MLLRIRIPYIQVMKKNEVKINNEYVAKVSGHLVVIKILRESPFGGWIGRSRKTGREVRIRTAARLRYAAARERVSGGLGEGANH